MITLAWGFISNILSKIVFLHGGWNNVFTIIKQIYEKYSYSFQISQVAEMITKLYQNMPEWVLYIDGLALMYCLIMIIVRVLIEVF